MEKQIEEMAKLTCKSHRSCYGGECIGSNICAVRENCEKIFNAGYRKQEWHKVSEELPETSGLYIVCTKKDSVCTAHYYADAKKFSSPAGKCAKYWTYMPEPPKGE